SQASATCGTTNDCPPSGGFCNHPGGPACSVDADCAAPPCVQTAQCVPVILGPPVSSITGDLTVDPTVDPLPPALLDGKILFDTAARDTSVKNGVGLSQAAPLFNDATKTGNVPGSVVSTSHDASYVTCPDRDRYFNPMLTVHWNGDRDEVEDFEHTFRSLMGSGDCDGAEDTVTCQGALVQRSPLTSTDPVDVNDDECAPNRNLVGASGKIVGIRLTHMADFVYSLTSFVKHPNPANEGTERGRQIFKAEQTQVN